MQPTFKFLLTLFFIFPCVWVQSQDFQWFKMFSDKTYNPLGMYLKTRIDTSGNLIVGGDDSWQGAYIHKLDTAGNIIWEKTLTTVTDLTDIAIDNKNNVILMGVYIGHLPLSDSFTLTDGGPNPNYYGQVFIAKFNPAGDLLWAISGKKPQELAGSGSFHSSSYYADTDAEGNIYTSGVFYDAAVFGNDTLVTPYHNDVPIPYLLKISPEGKVLFAKVNITKGVPLALFSSNDYVYHFYENDQKLYLLKYNFCGKYVKQITFPFYDLELTRKSNQGFYFIAAIEPAPCFNARSGPTYCTHTLAWYDFEKDSVISLVKISGIDYNMGNIVPDHNGCLYFCGNQYETAEVDRLKIGTFTVPLGSFIIKYNVIKSKVEWIKSYRIDHFGFASMSILDEKHMFIIGSFGNDAGIIPFNGTTLEVPNSGHTNIIGNHLLSDSLQLESFGPPVPKYRKINCNVQATNQLSISETISLNPNPCVDYIEITGVNIQSTDVYDLTGHKIRGVSEINQDRFVLDTSPMRSGIYFLLIKTRKGVFTRKICKISVN